MNPFQLTLAILAVWRVTHLVVVEDGPWDLFRRLRALATKLHLERLFGCFLCFSVWMATAFALLLTREWRVLIFLIPAISGGAILLERVTTRDTAPPYFEEEKENPDVLLRR
ncbi:MAG TPA: hypothetical protein VMU84_08395 [Thermoanaerobaculia bacterium]|nr:hypothetical protein [Thermoanaerobaculia bacterium]